MSRLTLLLCLFELIFSQVSADLATEAIIGGQYAKHGEFKYQVALESQGSLFCGGSIIADEYILTGAHCVTDDNGHIEIEPIKVFAGIHNLKETRHAIVEPVETVYIHKEFNRHTNENDIAILKLHKGLNLHSHCRIIEKISLGLGLYDLTGATAVVSGFGLQNMGLRKQHNGEFEELGGSTDGKLKYAEAHIVSNQKGAEVNKPLTIFETNICAQVIQRNKHHYEGVCTGDSGGPLVHRGELVGILSKSPFACDESHMTAIYTRVSFYLHLIHNVMMGKPGNDVISAKLPV